MATNRVELGARIPTPGVKMVSRHACNGRNSALGKLENLARCFSTVQNRVITVTHHT